MVDWRCVQREQTDGTGVTRRCLCGTSMWSRFTKADDFMPTLVASLWCTCLSPPISEEIYPKISFIGAKTTVHTLSVRLLCLPNSRHTDLVRVICYSCPRVDRPCREGDISWPHTFGLSPSTRSLAVSGGAVIIPLSVLNYQVTHAYSVMN